MLNLKPYIPGLLLAALIIAFSAGSTLAQIKIGTNGATIAPASLLELESANQGLLLPRMADTVAINALNPPSGMLIYLSKAPAIGLYVRKVSGWEYLTGSLGGNGNFNSLTVAGSVTAVNFSGNLTGNATTATTATTATNSNNSAVTNDIVNPAITYPVFVNSTPGNQPLRTSSGNLSYVPATGILTARGFTGPLTGDVTGNATSSIDAQNTVNMRITDDLVTATTMYPTFVTGTSGPLPPKVSSGRLSFIPLTGELTAPTFRGALLGNATSATSVTGNVAAVNGGTGQSIYSPGDMLYASTSSTLVKLPVGVTGTVLRVSSTNLPAWSTAGAGTVINVIGTPNRISVTDPTVSPVIDIASTYAGQASINTVGTITSGIWNGSPVPVASGGTGLATLPTLLLVGNGTSSVTTVTGPLGYVLTSTGTTTPPVFKASGGGDMILASTQTVTGNKTFEYNRLITTGVNGRTATIVASTGVGSSTVELPPDGIIVNRDRIETLSGKTLISPVLVTPDIGVAKGASLITTGSITAPIFVSNISTGTAPFTVNSTTPVDNLNIGGNAATATTTASFSGSLAGDVTGSQNATVVSSVAGFTSGIIKTRLEAVGAATDANTPNTIVTRGLGGNFSAGTITANLKGNVTGDLTGNASTATNATDAQNSVKTGITNENASSALHFPTFVTGTSGNLPQKTGGSLLTYVPNSGTLAASAMSAATFTSTTTSGAPFVVNSSTAVSGLNIVGNAGTATKLAGTVLIYGSGFDGSAALSGPVIGQFGGTGVNNGARTITIGGNFTTVGLNALILTTAGATNVTLPTSGTLYGTATGSFTSTALHTSLTDPTGTGGTVFATNPTMERPIASSLLADPGATYNTTAAPFGTFVTAATVSGTNLAGTITITVSGGSTGTNQNLATVTYSGTFPLSSYPILYPGNAAAAELGTVLNRQVFAAGSLTGFDIRSTSVAVPAGTYTWNYHVIGR